MKKLARKLLVVAASILSGFALPGGLLRAEGPFSITRVDAGEIRASAPLTSLYWSAEMDLLYAGTLKGGVETWRLDEAGKLISTGSAFSADLLAATLLTGGRYEVAAGGFAQEPKIAFPPGANVGVVRLDHTTTRALAIVAHEESKRVAVLCKDGMVVLEGNPLERTLKLDGKFMLPTWVDGPAPTSPSSRKVWLAVVDSQAERLKVWDADKFEQAPRVVLLPRVLATDAVAAAPLELVSVASLRSRGIFATGDRQGRLRTWKAAAATHCYTLTEATLATFSADGTSLVEYHDKQVKLRRPFSSATTVDLDADVKPPSSLQLDHVGDRLYAVAARRANAAGEIIVDRFDFDAKKSVALTSIPRPTVELSVVATNPAIEQAAGAANGEGVYFFERTAPATAADSGADKAVVTLQYARAGKRLFAVGKMVSLYDAIRRKLLAQSKPLKLANADASVTAARLWLDDDATEGRLLLGTSQGELELWKLTIDESDAAPIKLERQTSLRGLEQKIETIAGNQERVVLASRQEAVICQIDESLSPDQRLIVLERILPKEALQGIALNADKGVVYRLPKSACQQPIAAERVVFCSQKPLQHLAHDGADFLVAADEAGTLYEIHGSQAPRKVANEHPLAALAWTPGGKRLAAAVDVDGKSILRAWSAEGNVLNDPRDLLTLADTITAMLFGKDDRTLYVGQRQGRIDQLQLTDSSARRTLRLGDATSSAVALAWLPAPRVEAGVSEQGFDRMLVADGNGAVSLRYLKRMLGPGFSLAPPAGFQSPWYAALPEPGRNSIVFVGAGGEAWVSPWPLPRLLKGYAPDNSAIVAKPAIADRPPSAKALYAAAWFGQSPAEVSLIVAGADGLLHVKSGDAWRGIEATAAHQPVAALAAHPRAAVLAIGQGANSTMPTGAEPWLTVWSNDLDPAARKSWNGHRDAIRALAFSPDGKQLASADRTGKLLVWECAYVDAGHIEPPPFTTFSFGSLPPVGLAWLTADGQSRIAVGFEDGQIWVLEVRKAN